MQEGELAERQAHLTQALAELNRAALNLTDTEIRAPFDGVVSEKHTDVGAYVNVGGAVVSLINDLDLEVEADVPTDRLAGLDAGAVVDFMLDDGTRHSAIVRAVVPEENALTRTRLVRFTPAFDQTRKALAVNQAATVNIPIGVAREVVTIHKDAIVRRGGNAMVFVVRDGTTEMRPVQLGEAASDRFVVLAGVEAGEAVVIRGNETLQPGQQVRVLNGAADGGRPDGPPTVRRNGAGGGPPRGPRPARADSGGDRS